MIQFDKCHDCDKNYRAQKLTSKELEEGYGLASCSRIELICKLLEICRKCQPAFGMGKDILDKERNSKIQVMTTQETQCIPVFTGGLTMSRHRCGYGEGTKR